MPLSASARYCGPGSRTGTKWRGGCCGACAEALLEGANGDGAALLERALALPDIARIAQANAAGEDLTPTLVVRFRKDGTRLALFSMIVTIGTPLDILLQNLRLELFFPADDATAAWFAAASSAAVS